MKIAKIETFPRCAECGRHASQFLRWARPVGRNSCDRGVRDDRRLIEWRMFDLEKHSYGDALAPMRGRILVPQNPGLGLDPDPDVIRTFSKMS